MSNHFTAGNTPMRGWWFEPFDRYPFRGKTSSWFSSKSEAYALELLNTMKYSFDHCARQLNL